MSTQFCGILPALVTPLDEHGHIVPGALENLLQRVYAAGVEGVYVGGSTGEGRLLAANQRKALAELCSRLSPKDKLVIVHVGASTLAETLELAEHASTLPLAGISSLPLPGLSAESLPDFYRQITQRTHLPVIAYYFPALAGGELSFEQLLSLAELPQVAGIKYTDYDLYKLARLNEAGVTVFNGRDEVLAAGMLMGAQGGIGSIYNVAPRLFVQLYAAARTDRWNEARELQRQINRLITVLLRFPLIPAIKQVMSWSGIPCGRSLSDHAFLSPQQTVELRNLLDPFRDSWEHQA